VKRALVVINPISGVGRARPGGSAEVDLARAVLSDAGFATTVVVTTGPGHATDAVRREQATGLDLAVAWGGDGTMNDVARVLVATGVGLAIVPAGSGNGLARDLGVPMDPRSALAVAAAGTRRRIDVGDANGEYFFNVAGLGLDARSPASPRSGAAARIRTRSPGTAKPCRPGRCSSRWPTPGNTGATAASPRRPASTTDASIWWSPRSSLSGDCWRTFRRFFAAPSARRGTSG
jgi:hypothetical protein